MGMLANIEDPDEMKHNVISSRSALFAKTISLQRKVYNIIGEIITSDPSIYTISVRFRLDFY